MRADLIVCGLGPAGRAVAHRAAAHGLSVIAVDPHPDRRWPATYGAWADELPDWLGPQVIATVADRPRVWGTRYAELSRRYVVFDTGALQDRLALTEVRTITGRATGIERPGQVLLDGGQQLEADRIIDARGLRRAADRAEQTAYGLVLQRDCVEPTVFMDWRPDNGARVGEQPSFLYTIALGEDRYLFEETCLAGRPALPQQVLRDRLEHRLRSRAIEFDTPVGTERVRFPIEGGRARPGLFGAAGAIGHPATGYSVAAALAAADSVVTGRSIWPVSARITYRLRAAGLRVLLALPPAAVPEFFDAFFALPPDLQRAYLSVRDDPRAVAAAMARIFGALDWPLRRALAGAVLG
ncbi:MAG: lycopene cyclase [Nocardia sp.]|nr:lycopene cyclase [Nocardia sp.]